MRRRIPAILLLAGLITAISAIPASAETITVTGEGPTERGALVELFCPVGGHEFSGHLEAGQQAQVLRPPETPILVAASPTTYVDVLGGSYLLDQTTVTNEAGRSG